ncbi:MAG: hypothetical protein XD43_1510 [Thermococcales archaeon 44_46]|nr:MAG: hypothetical protein XD43_1510 [Thermococcales archaeon 44_46]
MKNAKNEHKICAIMKIRKTTIGQIVKNWIDFLWRDRECYKKAKPI